MKTLKKIIIGTAGPLIFFGTLALSLFCLSRLDFLAQSMVGSGFALIFSLVVACAAFVFFARAIEQDDDLD